MKHLHRVFSVRFLRIVLAAMLAITFVGIASAQDKEGNVGQVQQGLVGGTVVSADIQEQYGLVTLSVGCSGSLLRNNWVITAAHCIDNPDPANPGQFITIPENSVTLTANWKTVQVRQSARIISFRPNDVAIIRFDNSFTGQYANDGYNRDVYRNSVKSLSVTAFGRGIYQFAQGSGASATPSQRDGQFRLAYFNPDQESDTTFGFPNGPGGQTIAGGDSGGPSYVKGPSGDLLVGVHSSCQAKCLPGKSCAPPSIWNWVIATPRCNDASVAPVWDEINRYLGAFVPPAQFIGTFGKTPANYQPIWVYAIKNNGDLLWYRKDTGESPWHGPKTVGSGWNYFKDVIPAGGNSFYALTNDGNLFWSQHNGFNDGARDWKNAVNIGHGWRFSKIFSGGEGIIYAIKDDGTLLWYRHGGYANGGGLETFSGPKIIGSGWGQFKDVFSMGQGAIYAVRSNGDLLLYQHNGFATGDAIWGSERIVSSGLQSVGQINSGARDKLVVRAIKSVGWQNFRQIIPAGGGVILAITADGKLLWYKHLGLTRAVGFAELKETWEGPIEIGSGWQGFRKVFALLPVASAPVVR
jgi:hypothetical protein